MEERTGRSMGGPCCEDRRRWWRSERRYAKMQGTVGGRELRGEEGQMKKYAKAQKIR